MKQLITVVSTALITIAATCCSTPATPEQIEKMCENHVSLKGDLRGSIEEEEVGRVEKEYAVKEKMLKEEMARDLKGLDDVLEQKLKDMEKEVIEPTEEEAEEGKTPEQLKEERIAAAKASIDKKKAPIIEQFERLIKLLTPQRKNEVTKAVEYAAKRKATAEKALAECAEAAKGKDISTEKADCRIKSDSLDNYKACK